MKVNQSAWTFALYRMISHGILPLKEDKICSPEALGCDRAICLVCPAECLPFLLHVSKLSLIYSPTFLLCLHPAALTLQQISWGGGVNVPLEDDGL